MCTLRTFLGGLNVLLILAVGASDLCQAEKEIMPCKAEQIHIKTTTEGSSAYAVF